MHASNIPEGTPTPPQRLTEQRDACAVVWLCWLGQTAAALFFVAHYNGNVPFWDEYDALLLWLTHDRPLTLQFFWDQANEHRIPLPKLILVGLAQVTGTDFRAGIYVTVVLMSVLSAGLMVAARRLRGHTSYADAVFPLLLLHWGHWESFVMGMLLAFSLVTFLWCVVLLLLVNRGRWGMLHEGQLRPGPAFLFGLCLVLLPLCGVQGVVIAAPLALWLACVTLRCLWARPRRPGRILLVLPLPFLAGLVMAAYFLGGYKSVRGVPLCYEPGRLLVSASEFWLVGLGVAARQCWPYGWIGLGICMAAVVGGMAGTWKHCASERPAIAGISAFFLGALVLGVAVAHGRALLQSCFASRYNMMAVPWIVALYLAALRWGRPAGARVVQGTILFLTLWLALPNHTEGRLAGQKQRDHYQVLQAALRAGKSSQEVAELCAGFFYPLQDIFCHRLEVMQRAQVGPFAR